MIDCHSHVHGPAFEVDRTEVLVRAREAGVAAILVVGEDAGDDDRVGSLAGLRDERWPRLLPCFGYHPDRLADSLPLPPRGDLEAVFERIRASAPGLAAIGEVGLDHWYTKDPERRTRQEEVLAGFAALSRELGLALNVHSRGAARRTLEVLAGAGAERVLMHAFDGKVSLATEAWERHGYRFSITPSSIRSEQAARLIERLPLEALLLETDAPVLGPVRGERNEPANLGLSRDLIARCKGLDPREVDLATTRTAISLFGLERFGIDATARHGGGFDG